MEMKEARGLIEPVDVLLNVHIVVGLLYAQTSAACTFQTIFLLIKLNIFAGSP